MHSAVRPAARDAAARGCRLARPLLQLFARTRVARGVGLALLVALAGLLMVPRLQVPPAVRTSTTTAVGRAPTAVVVDVRTRRVFVANHGAASVTMLDAASSAVLATVAVAPHPSALAVAMTAGR